MAHRPVKLVVGDLVMAKNPNTFYEKYRKLLETEVLTVIKILGNPLDPNNNFITVRCKDFEIDGMFRSRYRKVQNA